MKEFFEAVLIMLPFIILVILGVKKGSAVERR